MNPTLLHLQRYVAIAFAAFSVLASARVIWATWAADVTVGGIIVALVLCLLAFGLSANNGAALKAMAVTCLLTALALPVEIFNPLAVGDYLAAGEEPPPFPGALLWAVPLEIFLLASAYVLDLPREKN